jgi:dolichyldiphosphatase
LYTGIGAWAVGVAYSRFAAFLVPIVERYQFDHYFRYHLTYHTPHQILWGFSIGVLLGLALYIVAELIPHKYPTSLPRRVRNRLLGGQVATWMRIRDGWDVWNDGGREVEWIRWRGAWEKRGYR